MADTNIGNQADTDTADNDSQAQSTKTYTQKEVDDMMARAKSAIQKKVLRPYEDLGDPEELRALKAQAEKASQEQSMKRGEFDKILSDVVSKKDQEIVKRDQIITDYRVNMPLVDAASRYRSVNPEQVKSLLRSNVRLNAEGEVEVVDTQGKVRYSDAGKPLVVDELVKEFLDSNPHFVQASAATTNTRSNYAPGSNQVVDFSKLDMKNPAHRKQYAEAKAKGQPKR